MDDTFSQREAGALHSETQTSMGAGEIAPKVHFKLWSALGYQYSAQVTPLVVGTYLSLTIGLGGSAGYFWAFVFVGIFQLIFCLAAAEMASAMPHSSGPAHWVIVLGPPGWSHVIGYILGWVTNCGWMCICAASSLYLAQLTMALVVASHPDFELQPWHTYLVYIAYSLLELFMNLPIAFKVLNLLLSVNIFLINLTSVFLLIILLVKATPKQSAHDVFVKFVNESGWSSDGVVFFLGILPGLVALGAFDNASHLTDEVANPSKQIPQVLLGSTVMGFLTGIPMIMVYEFCNVNPESLLEPFGGQPIVQLIYNATRSLPLTIIGTTGIILCFFIAGCSYWISWSRLYWSFSREGALPFGKYMSKLSGEQSLPLNALFLVTGVTIALGAIQLGSTIAMNALLGGAGLCTVFAFAVCFAFVIFRGTAQYDPNRWLNLGRFSRPCCAVTLVWLLFSFVWLCFPLYLPVTPAGMNYTVVVVAGFTTLSGLYWIFVYSRARAKGTEVFLADHAIQAAQTTHTVASVHPIPGDHNDLVADSHHGEFSKP